jgi:hypothetical protein
MKGILTALILLVPMVGLRAEAEPSIDPDQEASLRRIARATTVLTGRIEEFISMRLVGELGYSEFPPARQYLMHDLDGDGEQDLLLISTFGLPSGGNYEQSELLVALTSDPEVQRVTLGGRGSRIADRLFTDNGSMHVFVGLRVWARTDAMCCPSLSSTDEVVVEHRKVVVKSFDEIKKTEANQALQTTPMTRSVYERIIVFGRPQRGV